MTRAEFFPDSTAWPKEKRASRVPLTGRICRSAIDAGAVAAREPFGYRIAQRTASAGWRIGGQPLGEDVRIAQGLDNETGGRVLRLADLERHMGCPGVRLDAGLQRVQAFEGIRLQGVEMRVHQEPSAGGSSPTADA